MLHLVVRSANQLVAAAAAAADDASDDAKVAGAARDLVERLAPVMPSMDTPRTLVDRAARAAADAPTSRWRWNLLAVLTCPGAGGPAVSPSALKLLTASATSAADGSLPSLYAACGAWGGRLLHLPAIATFRDAATTGPAPATPLASLMFAAVLLALTTRPVGAARYPILLRAFAMLERYRAARRACGSADGVAADDIARETAYNLGRALHYVSATPLAVAAYEACLEVGGGGGGGGAFNTQREAAYNLVRLLTAAGDTARATDITLRYLSYD